MRKLTLRDPLATLITAAMVVPFVGYSVRGSMPVVQDPREMAGVVIAGTVLAFAVFGRKASGTGAFEIVMVTLGVLTLGFAIAALIAETMWALLVPAMAGLVLMWALALLHDAGYVAREHAAGARVSRSGGGGRRRLGWPHCPGPAPQQRPGNAQAGPCADRRTGPQAARRLGQPHGQPR